LPLITGTAAVVEAFAVGVTWTVAGRWRTTDTGSTDAVGNVQAVRVGCARHGADLRCAARARGGAAQLVTDAISRIRTLGVTGTGAGARLRCTAGATRLSLQLVTDAIVQDGTIGRARARPPAGLWCATGAEDMPLLLVTRAGATTELAAEIGQTHPATGQRGARATVTTSSAAVTTLLFLAEAVAR
jgi:hypothetical protein